MNKKRMAIVWIVLAASMWGTIGVTVKILSSYGLSAIQMVVGRLGVSAILLGLFLLITDKNKFIIRIKDIKWFVGTGIFSMLFFNTCYSAAVQLTSLSIAAVLLYTSPIFVTLFSIPIFKEKLTAKKIIAVVCSVLGCMLVSGLLSSNESGIAINGLFLGMCAAVGYAFYGILARVMVRRYHPLTILFYTFILAGIGGVFIGDVKGIVDIVVNRPSSMVVIIIAALICSIVPYMLYTTALKEVEASKASVIASIEPVVATLIGHIVFGEVISFMSIIGIVSVLSAIIILNVRVPKVYSKIT